MRGRQSGAGQQPGSGASEGRRGGDGGHRGAATYEGSELIEQFKYNGNESRRNLQTQVRGFAAL